MTQQMSVVGTRHVNHADRHKKRAGTTVKASEQFIIDSPATHFKNDDCSQGCLI